MRIQKAFLYCPAFIFILFFILPFSLTGQDELRFRHIGTEQGLSEGVVNCVLRDKKGFIWFGTQDGLNRYDGYSITVFKHNPSDSNSISGNFIFCLYEDNEGHLWIGTNGAGLSRYNPATARFSYYFTEKNKENTPFNSRIRAITEDAEGILWIGTEEGLYTLNKETGKIAQQVNYSSDITGFGKQAVWSISEGRNGMLWIGTYGRGLFSFNKKTGKFKNFLLLNKLGEPVYGHSHQIRSMFLDKKGMLWMGTDDGGLGLFDTEKENYVAFYKKNPSDPFSLSSNRITSLAQDAENENILWIGTLEGGLNRFDKEKQTFTRYTHDESNTHSLVNNDIISLFIDFENTVWSGTNSKGISAYFRSSNKFRHYKKKGNSEQSLQSNTILSLLMDREGLLWIGSYGGALTSFDRKNNAYTHYTKHASRNKSVLSLYEDRDGLIWIGTWGAGVNTYDKKTGQITSYYDSTGAPSNDNGTIVCILQDKNGTIWIGTFGGGLYSYTKSTRIFTNYNTKNGLGSNTVFCIYEDTKGNLWIGTEGGGISILNSKTRKFKNLMKSENKNSLSSGTVNCIYEDKEGNFWIGTSNGLNKYNEKKNRFVQYYEKDGLPNDFIYSIVPDNAENLWITTNKGVSRFNPGVENTEGAAFVNYDVSDGLQGEEFNQGAWMKSRDGEIFFGGVNGFNSFYPEKIAGRNHVPPVYITSFKKFGKEALLDSSILDKKYIELSWRDNFFSFDFVTIDFEKPGKNKYSYMLEGIDEDWSPASTRRYVSYPRLPGGNYTFRVRAMNSEGIWNNEGAVIHIKIIPPFWQTQWFYATCILLSVASVFIFIRYRTARILKEKKILEDKVEERTQELAQKNKDITSSIQYAKRIQEAILPPLDHIIKHLPETFILYKPKDIVSGDFYWFAEKNGKKIIAAADCTGHGVPGALMSMIGHNLLNQIVLEKNITDPGEILTELHRGVQTVLKQGSSLVDTSDGMDVALCSLDTSKREVMFSGAYRPLLIFSKGSYEKIDGNKFPIGGSQLDEERTFTSHVRFPEKGSVLYLFSDGYADQFGGEKGKKFMVKQLAQLLLSIYTMPAKSQAGLLNEAIENWKGEFQQVDDILVIGVKV